MPEDQTPAEKLENANKDYHEAADEVMMSEGFDVERKARVGEKLDKIFALMAQVNDILAPSEPPEEP